MPIGPVSPKDMGRAGRGSSSKGSVTAKGIGKAKPKAKGLTAAEVKTIRQARIDDARDVKDRLAFRGVSKTLPRGSVNYKMKGVQGSKLSKGKMPMTSNMEAKEGVKSGQLPKRSFSPTNSARQNPVPAKPSKTGPQTRKSVKKGK